MSTVIDFSHVSKRYVLARQRADTLRDLMASAWRRPHREEFWSLRDVTFEAKAGEALGIIGPNGAGKSTSLKILCRITRPTVGHVVTTGKVAALIEVGAGFHPDLTGRENVYLNGAIVGFTRRELDRRFDEIVDFAEVRHFIDVPVKRYSSGMQMRLAFAVAAHLESDILLVDEVLAVGDLAFQRKCITAIQALRRRGTTIVFVSHSMEAVASLCTRVLFLNHGEVAAVGAPDAVIAQYRRQVFGVQDRAATQEAKSPHRAIRLGEITIEDAEGDVRRVFATGETIIVRCAFTCRKPVARSRFHVAIYRAEDGLLCFTTASDSQAPLPTVLCGEGTFVLRLDQVNLTPGSYLVNIVVSAAQVELDRREACHGFVIDVSTPADGAIHIPHRWSIAPPSGSLVPRVAGTVNDGTGVPAPGISLGDCMRSHPR